MTIRLGPCVFDATWLGQLFTTSKQRELLRPCFKDPGNHFTRILDTQTQWENHTLSDQKGSISSCLSRHSPTPANESIVGRRTQLPQMALLFVAILTVLPRDAAPYCQF